MGQVSQNQEQQRRYWTLSNFFMVKDEVDFKKWIKEISEAYADEISIVVREDKDATTRLNDLATAINAIENRKYLLRPDGAMLYGVYIEGELPTVRLKSVKELLHEGETDVEEPEVRDIDFLEELSGHLYGGEVAMITTVGVEPGTFICARGYIVTSDGVTISPVPLAAELFETARHVAKYPLAKFLEQ